MGVGQLSESDAVDALRLPFYPESLLSRIKRPGILFGMVANRELI